MPKVEKAKEIPTAACYVCTLAEAGTYRARLEDTPLYAKQPAEAPPAPTLGVHSAVKLQTGFLRLV